MSPIIPNTLYYLLIKVKPTLFFQTESTKEMTMNRFRAKQKQKKTYILAQPTYVLRFHFIGLNSNEL